MCIILQAVQASQADYHISCKGSMPAHVHRGLAGLCRLHGWYEGMLIGPTSISNVLKLPLGYMVCRQPRCDVMVPMAANTAALHLALLLALPQPTS